VNYKPELRDTLPEKRTISVWRPKMMGPRPIPRDATKDNRAKRDPPALPSSLQTMTVDGEEFRRVTRKGSRPTKSWLKIRSITRMTPMMQTGLGRYSVPKQMQSITRTYRMEGDPILTLHPDSHDSLFLEH
ncbi:hypothetical protein Dimus_000372, partial [Dionaea muscipula]